MIRETRNPYSKLREQEIEIARLRKALQKMVDMIDFHYRDGYLPKNETDVPMEDARLLLRRKNQFNRRQSSQEHWSFTK